MPRLARRDHGGAEIDPRDRARRALADRAVEGDDEGRAVIALHQPAGDDANDARVPALADREDHVVVSAPGLDLGLGGGLDPGLDLAALEVERVEPERERRGLLGVLGGQQPRAEVGLAHAPARVQPRAENEGRVIGARWLAHPGDVGERPESQVAAPRHDLEPLAHQRPVDARQRHHVADRAERDQVEPVAQVGLGPGGEPAGVAERSVEPDQEQEGDADGGQLAAARAVVEPVGIDHGGGLGQAGLGDVMVDDDDVEPGAPRLGQRLVGADPAVDGHDHPHPVVLEAQKRRRVGAVAFRQPIGNVDLGARADRREIAREQRRRGRAVDVVVAEHDHPLAVSNQIDQAGDRLVHVGEPRGIGQQRAQARVEKGFGVVGLDPARGEHPADDLGKVEPLRERQPGAVVGEPRSPSPSADRALDAENRLHHPGQRASPSSIGLRWMSCWAAITRTVPVLERITSDWVVMPWGRR